MNKCEGFWPFIVSAVIKPYFSNMKEKFRFSVSVLEIPKLQFSVTLVLTLSNLHYECSCIFCPWKASGINCFCDLSVISNLLSIISSPRGPDYTNPVWKPEKNPRFYFYCLIQVIHKSHFRAKHLSLISGTLVFQFLWTSPEALLNLEIIGVIIIYSLHCHNTLDSPAPFLLCTAQKKHKPTPQQRSQTLVWCGHFMIHWYVNFLPYSTYYTDIEDPFEESKMHSDDRVQAFK